MASTSYSCCPSTKSGGGLVSIVPWKVVSLNGVNKAAWNTLWIFHCLGRVNRYVTGPSTSLIKKGPSRLGDSFLLSYGIFRFLDSNHTLSLTLNGLVLLVVLSIILVRAKSCAASASSRARNKDLMRSSAAGVLVLFDTRGSATGVVPYMS